MNESTLKKEFSQSTVQRMRNIITGKAGDRTQIQSGWEKNQKNHEEGDVWEESGKRWTIKNGIKQTVTKMDSLKQLVVLPLACPECSQPFKVHDINKKMYSLHGMCLDCVSKMETKIKIEGNWEKYAKTHINNNKNATVKDLEMFLDSWMNESTSIVTENGDVENWGEVDKTKIYQQIKSNIEKLKNTDI